MGRDRGDLVVFYEYVLATMRNVVGVLAGLNRVYVAPDKLKRVGAVVGRHGAHAAGRRRDGSTRCSTCRASRCGPSSTTSSRATLDLVEQQLPDVDTTRARTLWSLPAEPSEGGGGAPPPPSGSG